mgnify:CR=1 FL=1
MNKKLLLFAILSLFTGYAQAAWVKTNAPSDKTAYCFVSLGSKYFAGFNGGGVYKSTDNGVNWSVSNTGMGNLTVYNMVVSGGNIFAATSGGLYLSSDQGDNWVRKDSGMKTSYVAYSVFVKGTEILAATNSGIYKSSNNGVSWSSLNNGLDSTLGCRSVVAVGSNLLVISGQKIFRSANNGSSWTDISSFLGPNPTPFQLATDGTNIYLAVYSGLYKSTDGGVTWNTLGHDMTVYTIYTDGAKVYVGTDEGVQYTSINGTFFREANDGFGPVYKRVYGIGVMGNVVFASASQLISEVWKRPSSEMKTSVSDEKMNVSFSIYPNPSKDIFNVTSSVDIDDIWVQNIYGETVQTIGPVKSGESYRINLSQMSKGVYIVVYRVNGSITYKNVVLN